MPEQYQIVRQMIDDLREIVFRTDAEGRWTFLNAAWEEITGFAPAETLGKVFLDSVHPDDRAGNLERFRPLVERQKDYCRHEVRYLRKDGGFCWVEVHARAIVDQSGRLIGTCGTISNIDSRRAAIEALKRREAVLDAIGYIAQIFLKGGDWEAAIPAALERLGPAAAVDQIVVMEKCEAPDGRPLVTSRHGWIRRGSGLKAPDVPLPASEECERELESGQPVWGAVASFPPEIQGILRGFGIRHMAMVPILTGDRLWGNISFVRNCDLEFTTATIEGLRVAAGIVGAAIRQSLSQETLRLAHVELEKRVEARTADLRRSQSRFHGIFEQAPIGMVLTDPDGQIRLTNASLQKMLERTAAELSGATMLSVTHPDDRTASARLAQSPSQSAQIQNRYVSKSGREVWARTTVANLSFEDGAETLSIAMVEDITCHKKLEEEFLHAQRMEAVGRLTGGIAHDFNNILTVIKGYSELLLKALVEDPKAHRKATQIVKATERASNLVNQLLAFSRKRAAETKVMDVNSALGDMQGMLRRLLREDIELVMQLHPAAGSVKMDAGQFGQLLMNLAVNARDAIANAGKLTIQTRHVTLEQAHYSLIEVSDTGCGMTPDVRSRIFEPFFTTKDVGKGTGLGLSTAYGIVQQVGGRITVESAPGVGTTFFIYLPSAIQQGTMTIDAAEPCAIPGGSETILIAEDEHEVRALMAEALRDWGYTVIEARDGMEAMEMAAQHEGTLHLLLTDVVMPKMGGPELWDRLCESFPELRFLFTSGHTGAELTRGPAILHKPFSSLDLKTKVREILDAPRTLRTDV